MDFDYSGNLTCRTLSVTEEKKKYFIVTTAWESDHADFLMTF